MKSIVLVGSLGASLGFDGLSNEMAGGVGVLVWRLCTNVFTFCSSVFSELLSFFKRSKSCKRGISCCDAHLKKVNMVSSFCSSRDGLVTGRFVGFVGRDGLVTWCFVGRALRRYVDVLRNTLDGSGVVRGVMWCAAWGLASSWALGDAGSISVGAVCSGDEGEVCSGEEDVCGKGESEGCLQPDGIEDEGMSGRHESAEGWSPPDCCGEGKGSGGKTAAGHSLSVGRCRVASSVSLDMSGRSGVFWGEQSLIPPFHERSSVALGMGRVERHSRTAFPRPGYFLPPTKA